MILQKYIQHYNTVLIGPGHISPTLTEPFLHRDLSKCCFGNVKNVSLYNIQQLRLETQKSGCCRKVAIINIRKWHFDKSEKRQL